MVGKSANLVPFLKEGLATSKYINLKPVENATNTYMVYFPRMSPTLGRTCQLILKDWENLNKREYIYSENYSSARGRLQPAIKQSDFLDVISSKGGKIIFRILEPGEVLEKKLKKKIPSKIKSKEEDLNAVDHSPSSSSGYSSGEVSPANCGINKENGHAPLLTTQLDHDYTAFEHAVLGNPIHNVDPEEGSLEELYKIEDFLVTDTEKTEEIMQEYMEYINDDEDAAWLSQLLSETVSYEAEMHTPERLPNNLESASDQVFPTLQYSQYKDKLTCGEIMREEASNFKKSAVITEQTIGPENSSTSQIHGSTVDLSIEEQELQKEPISSSSQILQPRPEKAETANSVMAKAAAALGTTVSKKTTDELFFYYYCNRFSELKNPRLKKKLRVELEEIISRYKDEDEELSKFGTF